MSDLNTICDQRWTNLLGIYEKALPQSFSWPEKLDVAQKLGFSFVEFSVDESDERLERLRWPTRLRAELRRDIEQSGIKIPSMALTGHRRFPLGSHDPQVRATSLRMMQDAVRLALDLGIRVIQLAGYDVYYEPTSPETHAYFLENLFKAVEMASRDQVMLAIEIMDTSLINSISKYLWYDRTIDSPWLAVYPDIGNLSAWGNDVPCELRMGIHRIVAVHLKDALAVTKEFPGKFRDVPFGTGCVDFAQAFRTLAELHYGGPFLIEMWSSTASDALAQVAAARKFILAKMEEAGRPATQSAFLQKAHNVCNKD